MRGVASLDPASIIVVGLLTAGACLLFSYARKLLAGRRRRSQQARSPVRVSDARLYSRYRAITGALEGVGIVREPQETPEQYARRAALRLDEPGMERLGEIYLYARFRAAVPAAFAEEFDLLEPRVFAAIERLKEHREAKQTVGR